VARIIIGTSDPLADLSDSFVRALTLLTDNGFLPLTGTMLVSRYAVVVVDDRQILTAIDLLRDRNLPASVEWVASKVVAPRQKRIRPTEWTGIQLAVSPRLGATPSTSGGSLETPRGVSDIEGRDAGH